MNTLLIKLALLYTKYQQIAEEEEGFNIFPILRSPSDEVNLHSKFLFELLNDKGSHGFGSRFCEAFFLKLQIENFDFENYWVGREYKNIDLLIANEREAVIVENKIWAGDQHRQLERYAELLRADRFSKIRVFYLTPFGHPPSDGSVGRLDRKEIKLISYQEHISQWLDVCIKIASRNPAVRETLIQYQHLVKDLTGQNKMSKQKEEIIDLMSKDNNILQAQLLLNNWNHVRHHVEFQFWSDLNAVVDEKYEVLAEQKFSIEAISEVINKSRNRWPWYGLKFKLGMLHGYRVCVLIERGYHGIYYGVVGNSEKEHKKHAADHEQLNEYSEQLMQEKTCLAKQYGWLGWKYVKPEINFEAFSDDHTLKLIDKDYRKQTVDAIWAKVQQFVEAAKKGLESDE